MTFSDDIRTDELRVFWKLSGIARQTMRDGIVGADLICEIADMRELTAWSSLRAAYLRLETDVREATLGRAAAL